MSRSRAALLDVLCVVAFVVIGRRSHDEGSALAGTLRTAAPFLVALAGAWTVARRLPVPVVAWRYGALLWCITVPAGMLLRRVVFGRGTAAAFVVVATVFLALTLIGWRVLANAVARRRAPST